MIAGLDHHGDTDVHADSDAGFQALTIQGVSSFLAMFGAVGYTLFRMAPLLAALFAIVARSVPALFTMWLIHKVFRAMMRAAVERHREPVRRRRQRRLRLSHGVEGRRPRADQLRQPPARVRGRVGRWRDAFRPARRSVCKASKPNTLVVAPADR